MSPASKNADAVLKENKMEVTQHNSNLHDRISKVMLVKPNLDDFKSLNGNEKLNEILALQRSIKSETVDEVVQEKVCNVEIFKVGIDNFVQKSSFPLEKKKSVRFEDDVFQGETEIIENSGDNKDSGAPSAVSEKQMKFCTDDKTTELTNLFMNCTNLTAKQKRQAFAASSYSLQHTPSQKPFNLRRERTFEEEKSFHCLECEKSFKYRSNLKTHILLVHRKSLNKSHGMQGSEDFLMCDVCSHMFKYQVNLRAHQVTHTRNKLSSTI